MSFRALSRFVLNNNVDLYTVCVFFYGLPGNARDWGFVFERPIRTQVLRGPSKLCQVCGSISCGGSRDFYAHIWELWRHHGHMGCMLDSDWSRKFLLRCDWLGLLVASITTQVAPEPFNHWYRSSKILLLVQEYFIVSNIVKCFAHVGKKNVSYFPFINGSQDFIGCLNNHKI